MPEPSREATPLLRADQLSTYYPIRRGVWNRTTGYIRAVDGVTLEVYPGETLGLVGESGCGKSTLGRTLLRLEEPHAGRIYYEGDEVTTLTERRLRPYRTHYQMIFQDPYASLNPRMTAGELVAEPLLAHRLAGKGEALRLAHRLLELVGLPRASAGRYPHQFSGGQRQRIGIARALAVTPKLIVCDEPVSALDVSVQAQILHLLQDLQRELDLTYIFIAHGLGAVHYISTRVAVMYLGTIVEIADKRALFASPKHPYTRMLLNASPVSDPRRRGRAILVPEGDVPSASNPPSGCRFHTRCPIAMPRCVAEEPALTGGAHAVACHYPLGGTGEEETHGLVRRETAAR
ncbi:peptide/nickel transport system ATP-binding protein/oligopeptide transport system ATP-binding protein [Paenibacillus methanolicus]|uniref:Peptide/nickel transport system ATP-binding protein/oligopeptide transport system ATP-binding protein n=2 Tax=Paenibacillus methanolicus TaxID=582686 RepID=A0A5S5CMI7_9BACL|nr:peptide/nickel transport system ATP-binding protein/oligopeptide transport system ATP-binding protein [Paenibacillus methanolicus]